MMISAMFIARSTLVMTPSTTNSLGTNPNSADNRWLHEAMEGQIPVIYFLGTSPGRYQPIIPTFIVGWHPERLQVQLSFGALVGASAQAVPPDAPERRYAVIGIDADQMGVEGRVMELRQRQAIRDHRLS
jgi:hypothetical protein